MKTVLLFAGWSERYYYDAFLQAAKNNVKILVFSPDLYPSKIRVSLEMSSRGLISGHVGGLWSLEGDSMQEHELDICDIDTAWYLRDGHLSEKNVAARFRINESRAAVNSLMSVLRCSWINKRESIEALLSNKLLQQSLATRCGLLVPRTLLCNDFLSIEKFSRNKTELLLKTLGYTVLDSKAECFIYSELFTREELLHAETSIRTCPIFTQEYIEKKCEYRIMVIGNQVLACRIDSQASEKTKIDWRHYDFAHVQHRKVDLPPTIQFKLLEFMKLANLQYGAIDMIETPSGEFVFLEVNPSGQWGWIDNLTDLNIPQAVINMLQEM